MISFQSVGFVFQNGTRGLHDVTLEIGEGITAIIGANGAGKTTLVRHMNGLLVPKLGNVFVNGQNTRDATVAQLSRMVGILNKGELQLTTEQRRQLIGDKKKQIISLISRNYVDPRTGTPHPPMRIEQAFVEARVSVDPFKGSDEQAKLMADQIRAILPLKADKVKLQIKVPAAFTSQSLSILKNYGDIMKEDWGSQGVLTALVEIPAGVQSGLLDKLGSLTKGGAEITLIK